MNGGDRKDYRLMAAALGPLGNVVPQEADGDLKAYRLMAAAQGQLGNVVQRKLTG